MFECRLFGVCGGYPGIGPSPEKPKGQGTIDLGDMFNAAARISGVVAAHRLPPE
jgi:hypothetical protein